MTTLMLIAFATASQQFELPPGLLSSVCYVESGHRADPPRVNDGGSHSLGICQVKLATARLMGFKGTEDELAKPCANIYYAGKYLGYQISRYQGNVRRAVSAYNAGRANKGNFTYVSKVMDAWIGGVP